MKQRIAYPDNPVMAAAFINFVAWAGGRPDILDWYHNATGRMPFWAKPRSAIEKMIDEASGYDIESTDHFVDWLIENIWGDDPFAAGAGNGGDLHH